jgi:cytochrome P450 family 142 subfamily A polypeptide 1
MPKAIGFDHLVLVVSDIERSLAWYQRHLGLAPLRCDEWRRGEVPFPSLRVDEETIIDFIVGPHDGPGSLNHICFVLSEEDLALAKGEPELTIVEEGARFGARGVASSIYVHDPDGLLVEMRAYPTGVVEASGDAHPFEIHLRPGTRTAAHPTRPDISVLTPEFYERFDELTAWMRTNAPIYWDDTSGIWAITTHADVTMMSRDWHTFCSGKGSRPESSVPSMINFDPPEHTRRRRVISPGFALRRVEDHEPFLRRTVTALIDDVVERGECDIVRDLATPLPMRMIGELMDLPPEDHDTLLHWSDLFATGGQEIRPQMEQAVRDWWEYILTKVNQRRGAGGDDLISLIVNAVDDEGPFSDVDLVFELMLVLVGGDETTRHVISGGTEALLRHPDQLAALRADPTLLPGAIEEMLRWVTPVRNMNRTATKDVQVRDQHIREGDRLLLLYPSANRDETVFDHPDRFDIRRSPNDHFAFGAYGRHHCLGAPLARLELRVFFEELLRRLPELELAGATRARRGIFVLGLESVPVRFRPGPKLG